MKQLRVMRGVSGSGKTTVASGLMEECLEGDNTRMVSIVSADAFFADKARELGISYKEAWDPNELGEAHGACFRKCIDNMRDRYDLIIVDNTSTRIAEIAPYMLAASAYGYAAKIIRVPCALDVAAARNVHDVAIVDIARQADNIENDELPPWWEEEIYGQ